MRLEIICTGDEVLTGKIVNTNFSYMSQKLDDVGLAVQWETPVGDDGMVNGAIYYDTAGVERRQKAEVVVIACNGIGTPRLLLNSRSQHFPDGLANRSGLVGKNLMSHPSIEVRGRAREKVHPYRIGFSTAMSRQFAVEGNRSTRGAFFLEFLNSAGPTPARIATASGRRGDPPWCSWPRPWPIGRTPWPWPRSSPRSSRSSTTTGAAGARAATSNPTRWPRKCRTSRP